MCEIVMKENRFVRICGSISRICGSVSGVCGIIAIFAMTILITVDVAGRYVGKPTGIADEASGYMMVGITFLGLAYTQRKGRNIRITMLTDRFSTSIQKRLEIPLLLVTALFVGWLTWLTTGPVIQNYVLHRLSITELRMPMWITWLMVPIGLAMLDIELIVEFIKAIWRGELPKEEVTEFKADMN